MKHANLSWKTADGIDIFAQKWEGDSTPKAVICIVHGMGEHSGRYAHWASRFVTDGYAVIAYDQRGHGKSGGGRGHTPSYEVLMDDVALFLRHAATQFKDIPQILYGHSMGGGVVTNFVISRKPAILAAIFSAPYYRLAFEPPKLKIMAGKWMENLLPALTLPTGLDANHISRDKEEVRKYKADPLVHDKISAKMGMQVIDYGEKVMKAAGAITIPFLLIHGTGDQLTSYQASKEFMLNAASNGTAKFYEGLYHELHNEPEKDQVYADIISFLNSI